MVEWGMLFTLGLLVASLLWLLALPVLSARAQRLARERLVRHMPVSPAEVAAERDQLRAGHAVTVRRLEQALGAAQEAHAAALAGNGRLASRTVALEQAEARLREDGERLARDLAAATRARREAEATLGAQTVLLDHALALAERRAERLRETEARLGASLALAAEQDESFAAMEARATAQDMRLRAALQQVAALTEAAARARSDPRNGPQNEPVTLPMTSPPPAPDIAALDALRAELDRLREALALAQREAGKADARAQLQAETIAGLADRVLRQDGELEQARRAATVAPRPDPGDEAALRAAIAALGADLVAFVTRAPDGEADTPAG